MSTRIRFSRLTLTFGVLLVCNWPAGAQERRLAAPSDSVPRSLAETLVQSGFSMLGMFGTNMRDLRHIVVGELPPGLAGRLWLPADAHVLGGVGAGGFVTAIIETGQSLESLRTGFRRAQPGLGWTAAKSASAQRTYGGFVPADYASPPDSIISGLVYCAAASTLTISVDSADGGLVIRAMVLPVQADMCTSRAANDAAQFGLGPHPTLRNPPGSGDGFASDANCAPFNSSGGNGITKLATKMSIEAILDHYGRQLIDSGWIKSNGETRGETWTRTDSSGTYSEVTLTAQRRRESPQCIDVHMETSSRTKR